MSKTVLMLLAAIFVVTAIAGCQASTDDIAEIESPVQEAIEPGIDGEVDYTPETVAVNEADPVEETVRFVTINGIEYSTSLTFLELSGLDLDDDDITVLRYMINLTSIDLSHNKISDISPLSHLTNLTVLFLHDNQIRNISPLIRLVNLERVSLGWNQISDLSPLSELAALQVVDITENPISEIPPEFISIRGNLYRTSLTELVLEEMWFMNEDIVPLRYMTNLRHLEIKMDFCACGDSECYPVCEIYDLQQHRISDISPLSGLVSLESVSLRNHQIVDITPLSELSELRRLDLGKNNVFDVAALAELRNLEILFLDDNQINDITLLTSFSETVILSLENNPITDWSPVAHIENVAGRP